MLGAVAAHGLGLAVGDSALQVQAEVVQAIALLELALLFAPARVLVECLGAHCGGRMAGWLDACLTVHGALADCVEGNGCQVLDLPWTRSDGTR